MLELDALELDALELEELDELELEELDELELELDELELDELELEELDELELDELDDDETELLVVGLLLFEGLEDPPLRQEYTIVSDITATIMSEIIFFINLSPLPDRAYLIIKISLL